MFFENEAVVASGVGSVGEKLCILANCCFESDDTFTVIHGAQKTSLTQFTVTEIKV